MQKSYRSGCHRFYRMSILALGAGASTKFVMNDRIERAENVKDIKNYIERIDEMIERISPLSSGYTAVPRRA